MRRRRAAGRPASASSIDPTTPCLPAACGRTAAATSLDPMIDGPHTQTLRRHRRGMGGQLFAHLDPRHAVREAPGS